jgi:hypothetical protein
MVNKENLDAELFAWKQNRLEEGKFPCLCGHFETAHVKRMCIACHGKDTDHESSVHGEGFFDSCFHEFKIMDNLTLIEWFAQHKNIK